MKIKFLNQLVAFSFSALIFTASAQVVDPFHIKFQTSAKGGIRYLSNVNVGCGANPLVCNPAGYNEVPPAGTFVDNNFPGAYIDIDGNATTFSSSSDSLNLPACSQIVWAGLFWASGSNGAGAVLPVGTSYRDIKVKLNNGTYQTFTADNFNQASSTHKLYTCFKNITPLLQSAGANFRVTVADLYSQNNGIANSWGGWTIAVVYKNDLLTFRELTVFEGLADVNTANSPLDIPVNGFLTPPNGPVSLELGLIVYDGDRNSTGDNCSFSGANQAPAATFVPLINATNPANDVFNGTITYNGLVTPFRNPNLNNTAGMDADIFLPNNNAFQLIGNNATSFTFRQTTGGENFFTQMVSTAIDVYEPDSRASVKVVDLNGGLTEPGDVLEYTVKGINIGSDPSGNTFITDTIEGNATYVPNSLVIIAGQNLGPKTDAPGDDQAEVIGNAIKVRVGTGAGATLGGVMANSPQGADSTVFKFRVVASNNCVYLGCDNIIDNRSFIFGTGLTSGNTFNNGSNPGIFDANGCPIPGTTSTPINTTACPVYPDVVIPSFCLSDDFSGFVYAPQGYSYFNAAFVPVTDGNTPGVYYAIKTAFIGCADTVLITITAIVAVCDNDGDGVLDVNDLDNDNDGIPDSLEGTTDADLDGVPNNLDLDSDNDGITDVTEAGGPDTNGDGVIDGFSDSDGDGLATSVDPTTLGTPLPVTNTDGDAVPNYLDLDSDNDGITDCTEAGGVDANGNGTIDGYADANSNGLATSVDPNSGGTPLPKPDTDDDGKPNYLDLDSDNDGITDVLEAGGPDTDGNGIIDGYADSDNDGLATSVDPTTGGTQLPKPNSDGDGRPNYLDIDSDNDGITDCTEAGGIDTNGDGKIDGFTDTDGDGLATSVDPNNGGTQLPKPDTDNDGKLNFIDIDADNDGIVDNIEAQLTNNYTAPTSGAQPISDTDNDGLNNAYDPDNGGTTIVLSNSDLSDTPDYLDLDSDNDGDADLVEGWDTDNNNVANTLPAGADADGDGLDDAFDTNDALWNPTNGNTPSSFPNLDVAFSPELDWRETADNDGDGVFNGIDLDDDNDGILDTAEGTGDADGDGIPNAFDLDADNDGIPDIIEAGGVDTNGDGKLDNFTDTDNDGLGNAVDVTNGGTPLAVPNTDGDSRPNFLDLDSDNDGITDVSEAGGLDVNGDGIVDGFTDANSNGFADAIDTATGGTTLPTSDKDTDGKPNYIDLDSDNDGITDCTEAGGTDADGDGIIDGFADSDGDGLANSVDPTTIGTQLPKPDTDGDGKPNYLDLDSDNDGITDLTESGSGAPDSQVNGVVDGTDTDGDGIINTPQTDTNSTFGGTTTSPINSDSDIRPNYLDLDSDNDGITDLTESGNGAGDLSNDGVADGASDANNDGILDGAQGTSPTNPLNTDGDTKPNYIDIDADNDGITDCTEAGGIDANGNGAIDSFADSDGDGLSNTVDPTTGGNALPRPNSDNDTKPNWIDVDSDNDGITDCTEAGGVDADGNGIIDGFTDTDLDGLSENVDPTAGNLPLPRPDTDLDGRPNYTDLDADNDGITDCIEAGGLDADGNGAIDNFTDSDGDGLSGNVDPSTGGTILLIPNTDLDSKPNYLDLDSDNDGITDCTEAGGIDVNGNGVIDGFTDGDNDGLATSVDPQVIGTPGVPLIVPNTDGDTKPNYIDLDSDNDGITDVTEAGGPDVDGNGIIDSFTDTDSDGLATSVDASTGGTPLLVSNTDGDSKPNYIDLDSDNDGITDVFEAGGPDVNGDGTIDSFTDTDNDGLATSVDPTTAGTALTIPNSDGDTRPNYLDIDSDNDGITDCVEAGGIDANGDGKIDNFTDTDLDGLSGNVDPTTGGTQLPKPDTDGDTHLNYLDIDADNDGIVDNIEGQSTNTYITPTTGAQPVSDSDNDGLNNAYDSDNGGTPIVLSNVDDADNPDYLDLDSDNDGDSDLIEGWDSNNDGTPETVPTANADADNDGLNDAFDTNDALWNPTNGNTPSSFPNLDVTTSPELDWRETTDNDSDGISNTLDLDDDNDGILDTVEGNGDLDSDGVPNAFDLDSDNDGIPDVTEAGGIDLNGNGIIDGFVDVNNDGYSDPLATTPLLITDTDLDGRPNYLDLDSDNDGILDVTEAGGIDANGDGFLDGFTDSDTDGLANSVDPTSAGTPLPKPDTDSDGKPNYLDLDSDNDGITDLIESGSGAPDLTNDGIVDGTDSDNDGIINTPQTDSNNTFGGTVTAPLNSDDDVHPNYVDLDADNDGIYDLIESGYQAGDTNNNGILDGNDTDGDGLINVPEIDNDGIFGGGSVFGGANTILNTDGDAKPNYIDLDADNDGIYDLVESGSGAPDSDSDGIIDGADTDNDGVINTLQTDTFTGFGGTATPPINSDTDPKENYIDLDSDNDGISDLAESGSGAPDATNNGIVDGIDSDGDGIVNTPQTDNFAGFGGNALPPNNNDGDTRPNYLDLDSDNDGITDLSENGLGDLDPGNDGRIDTQLDADGDGVIDAIGVDNGLGFGGTFPVVANQDKDNRPNYLDLDSDNDGITDVIEAGGSDPDNNGIIGTGPSATIPDTFANGLSDVVDPVGFGENGTPLNPANTDNTGLPNYLDIDSDNDGIVDLIESQATLNPINPANTPDTDGDGIPDAFELDSDGDGLINAFDLTNGFGGAGTNPVNTDGADLPDYLDLDTDNDGVTDAIEGWDTNNDGVANTVFSGVDTDNDGLDNNYDADDVNPIPDNGQTAANFPDFDNVGGDRDWRDIDSDRDGIDNGVDIDDDNDGLTDLEEQSTAGNNGDTDTDGILDILDLDSDNDGINDVTESGGSDPDNNGIIGTGLSGDIPVGVNGLLDALDAQGGTQPVDTDSDGHPDYQDLDADNDGINDLTENGDPAIIDLNNDGVADGPDTDQDGISNSADTRPTQFSDNGPIPVDTDGDTHPDYQDLDADNDGINDLTENGDQVLDENNDGVVDGNDEDGDGIKDSADPNPTYGDAGPSPDDTDNDNVPNYVDLDADNDGINDLTENGDPAIVDANNDGVVDGPDTDNDGIQDSADPNAGFGDGGNDPVNTDVATDDVPDYLDLDSDNDGINDLTENTDSTVSDTNSDGVVDGPDTDGDGIQDSADPNTGFGDGGPKPVDTDLDGNPDYTDLDSDNDGLNDLVESGFGLLDANNDGVVDGPDTDGDGIIDAADGAPSTFGDANQPKPADKDNNGKPDYQDLSGIDVPEAFTPNGDGKNDFLVIKGIEGFKGNNIEIFNRWGNIVYKTSDYKNDWAGTANTSLTAGGENLPTGTYFYVIDTKSKTISADGTKTGDSKNNGIVKGYIYIQR